MIDFKTYKNHDLTIFTALEDLNWQEWIDMYRRYMAQGVSRYELYDLRSAKTVLTLDEVRSLTYFVEPLVSVRDKDSKTAFLVNNSEHVRLINFYKVVLDAIQGQWASEIFYRCDDAQKWLGIDITAMITENLVK